MYAVSSIYQASSSPLIAPRYLERFQWNNGFYEGEALNRKPNGSGRWIHDEIYEWPMKRYEGQFERGEFSGRGTAYYYDGSTYTGDWANGWKHGSGTYKTAQLTYEGGFSEGAYSGTGKLTFRSSTEIVMGEFDQGIIIGTYRHEWPNGDVFEGTTDMLSGKSRGTFFYADRVRREEGVFTAEFAFWKGDQHYQVLGKRVESIKFSRGRPVNQRCGCTLL